MYCGNNAHHPGLLNHTQVLGTRYNCLLKGKQFGYSLPPDASFTQPYAPIDPTRKYCGNSPNVPNGYNRFGSLYECYLTGVGVGKKQKATQVLGPQPPPPVGAPVAAPLGPAVAPPLGPAVAPPLGPAVAAPVGPAVPRIVNSYLIKFLIFTGMFLAFFFGFYYGKPSFILDNTDPQPKIDWSKFTPYLLCFSIILAYLIHYFF